MSNPQSPANRAGFRLISALVGAVGLSWVATATQDAWWVFFLAVSLVIVVVFTFPTGFLSRSPGMYGPTPLGRFIAGLLLLLYVGLAPLLASQVGIGSLRSDLPSVVGRGAHDVAISASRGIRS